MNIFSYNSIMPDLSFSFIGSDLKLPTHFCYFILFNTILQAVSIRWLPRLL